MVNAHASEVPAARRHLIKRPRLTRMLEESGARIVLLVAPAGYGKTTLAREWLQEKRHVWYHGASSDADVAALAIGVATAAAQLVSGADRRIRERLRATKNPESEADVLGELVAEELKQWPAEGWFAFDDCQFVGESKASEMFLQALLNRSALRLIATMRERPRWVTARHLLYGQAVELDRAVLAMNEEEVRAVLGGTSPDAHALYDRTEGWPAVIGLAALTSREEFASNELPLELHAFFAEELFQRLSPNASQTLCELAALPALTEDVARELVGDTKAKSVLTEAARVGFWASDRREGIGLHPLLRTFLLAKLGKERSPDRTKRLTKHADTLIAKQRWDDAFGVVEAAEAPDALGRLIEAGAEPLLAEGRTATLERWVSLARNDERNPWVTLTAAELAFRQGQYARAESFAIQAAERFSTAAAPKARGYILAGQSAALAGHDERAFALHQRARRYASKEADKRDALLGLLYAALDLDREEDGTLLHELSSALASSPEAVLRIASARLVYASRRGALAAAIVAARPALSVVGHANDPLAESSLLHVYSSAAASNAEYAEALQVIDQLIEFASHYRLDFVFPHAYHSRALALAGIRRFAEAIRSLKKAESLARASNDYVCLGNIETLAARLAAQGRMDRRPSSDFPYPGLSKGVHGEYVASQALLAASQGSIGLALELALQASEITKSVETATLVECVYAAVAMLKSSSGAAEATKRALGAAQDSGFLDFFVCTYRVFPVLLRLPSWSAAEAARLAALVGKANDHALARMAHVIVGKEPRPTAGLSPREREVAELLVRGLSNRTIAETLFISEPTAKLHVRHIFDKLGVRSRTQVAVRLAHEIDSSDEDV